MTKDKYSKVLDSGDVNNKVGRRFGYSKEEFVGHIWQRWGKATH